MPDVNVYVILNGMISGGAYGSAALGGIAAPRVAAIPIGRPGRPGIILNSRNFPIVLAGSRNSGDEPLELKSAW